MNKNKIILFNFHKFQIDLFLDLKKNIKMKNTFSNNTKNHSKMFFFCVFHLNKKKRKKMGKNFFVFFNYIL